jgi:cytochrome c
MKRMLLFFSCTLVVAFMSCGGNDTPGSPGSSAPAQPQKSTDPKGLGEVKHVELTDPLEENMIKSGKAIYEMKCSACHKLTAQRVVGPGWAGVTNKRRPEWIMNMITNTDIMLDQDATAQKLLEECLTRMPNQGLSVGDARDVLEYMRQNDLTQVNEKDKAAKM